MVDTAADLAVQAGHAFGEMQELRPELIEGGVLT
jgi:hypothetical protein